MTLSPLILAAALSATAAKTGQMSPTSDVSSNRVKPRWSTTSRAITDIAVDAGLAVRGFGAGGNGTTNDTAAVQAAIDAAYAGTVKTVLGNPGDTYLVRYTGTRTWAATAQRYALSLPSGVTLDCRGATIKLDAAQNSAIILNASAGTGTDTDLGIVNCVFDGNRSNQTNPDTGDMPVVFMYGVMRPRVEHVTVKDARQYSGRFLGITDGRFDWLDAQGSDGDCWSFGVDDPYLVKRSHIDHVKASNCIGTVGGGYPLGTMQGNPAIFTVQNTQVGKVEGIDSYGGIKIQNSSADATFDSLVFVGSTVVGSDNSGVKVQGYPAGGLYPDRITINSVISTNAKGNGLYLNDTKHVHVKSYHGHFNNWGGSYVDMWIDSSAASIDSVYIASTQGSSASTVRATNATWPVNIGDMFVEDIGTKSGSTGMSIQANTITRIRSFTARDARASPFLGAAASYNDGTAIWEAQTLATVAAPTTGLLQNATPTTGSALVFNSAPIAQTFTATAASGVDAINITTTGARLRMGNVYWDTTSGTFRTTAFVRVGNLGPAAGGALNAYGLATDGSSAVAVKIGNEGSTLSTAGAMIANFYSDGMSTLKASVTKDGFMRIGIGNTSACPTCASGLRGTLCYVGGGAGVKDDVQVCAKGADDNYAWRTLY